MGHTLILNGVSVLNPIAQLTLADAPHLLAGYYSANTSINDTEKAALEALVDSLWDAGVWNKIRSFYPMLGNTTDDLLLDAKNVTADNYVKQNLSDRGATISATTRNFLSVSGGNNSSVTNLTRTDIRLYGLTHVVAYGSAQQSSVVLTYYVSPGCKFAWGLGGYRYMYFELDSTQIPASGTDAGDQSSYVKRNVIYSYDGSTAAIYKDGALWKSGTIQKNDYVVSKTRQTFYLMNNISFFAQLDNLTADELTAYYNAVATFITALNKSQPV